MPEAGTGARHEEPADAALGEALNSIAPVTAGLVMTTWGSSSGLPLIAETDL